jgi:DNA processing protein
VYGDCGSTLERWARFFERRLTELEATGMLAVSAQAIATGKSLELAQEERGRAAGVGAHVVTLDDAAYPGQLKQIYDPPPILYVRGSVEALSKPGIAMVGTRHPAPCGTGMAERLATDLAAHGLVIFSGMARGWIRLRIAGRLRERDARSQCLGPGLMCRIRRRTRDCRSRLWHQAGR